MCGSLSTFEEPRQPSAHDLPWGDVRSRRECDVPKLIADLESKPLILLGCSETKFLQCVMNLCVYAAVLKWEADAEGGIKHAPCLF